MPIILLLVAAGGAFWYWKKRGGQLPAILKPKTLRRRIRPTPRTQLVRLDSRGNTVYPPGHPKPGYLYNIGKRPKKLA